MGGLDAHERPPAALRELYKRLRKLKDPEADPKVLVLDGLEKDALPAGIRLERCLASASLASAFDRFMGCSTMGDHAFEDVPVFTTEALPGTSAVPTNIKFFPGLMR